MKKLLALFSALLRAIADRVAPVPAMPALRAPRPAVVELEAAPPAPPADKLEALVQVHGPLTRQAKQMAAAVYLEDALSRYQPRRVPGQG